MTFSYYYFFLTLCEFFSLVFNGEYPRGIVANVLDSDLVVSEFKPQLYYVHLQTKTLGKAWNPLSSSYGLNSIAVLLLVRLLWHYITLEVWYAIKQKKNNLKPFVFQCSLYENKSYQVSRTLLNMQADLKSHYYYYCECCFFLESFSH